MSERNIEDVLQNTSTNHGESLAALSSRAPALVVFLRHLGCTFCREALADLRDRRERIESGGAQIVLVHMAPEDVAAPFFDKHGLGDLPRISDPDQSLYRAFGLRRGSLLQLFGPKVWWRGLVATLRGHRVGKLVGDGFQMPGAFLVRNGKIVSAFRHRSAADRPDYTTLACGVT